MAAQSSSHAPVMTPRPIALKRPPWRACCFSGGFEAGEHTVDSLDVVELGREPLGSDVVHRQTGFFQYRFNLCHRLLFTDIPSAGQLIAGYVVMEHRLKNL